MTREEVADVIIIGSGIAALIAADKLSEQKNVIILTKSKIENSNSIKAQGGVAAAVSSEDHWKHHYHDTIIAGSEHNVDEAVELLVQNGPKMIRKLIRQGMSFDRDHKGTIHLGKEGAHSKRRILHAGGDATGHALIEFMLEKVKQKVTIFEEHMAIDLLIHHKRCVGVKVKGSNEQVRSFYANHIILATGGCGGLYTFTSNDPSITGDGLAMAYRAGAELADLEFIQFHPTMLYVNGCAKGLISEAVRGEGAILVTASGKRLMKDIHPQKDLAPRDIVAREIHKAVVNGEKVYLDISMIKDFNVRFPTITELCEKNGINLDKGFIPVVPGAHFLMGGVVADTNGQTSIPGLYAIGEVACTGVHGANRLASNSLLEGIVFANEMSSHILNIQEGEQRKHYKDVTINKNETEYKLNTSTLPSEKEIKTIMMNNVGIVRDKQGLEYAKTWFEQYLPESFHSRGMIPDHLSSHEIIIYNMLTTGWLITTSALLRKESRGGHFRRDFPERKDLNWKQKQLIRHIN